MRLACASASCSGTTASATASVTSRSACSRGIISSTAVFYEATRCAQALCPDPCTKSGPTHIDPFDQRMDPRRRRRHRRRGAGGPGRHRGECPRFQALQAQPEAAVLPHQNLQLPPIPAEEEEGIAAVGLMAQLVLDHARQRVDATPHVLRVPRHIDPSNRAEAQHARPRQVRAADSSARASSGGTPLVNVHRRPEGRLMLSRCRRRRPRRAGG